MGIVMLAAGFQCECAGYGAARRFGRGEGARRRCCREAARHSRAASPTQWRGRSVAATTAVVDGQRRGSPDAARAGGHVQLTPSIATQAAWLYKSGWPLYALVDKFATSAPLDEQTQLPRDSGLFRSARRNPRGSARRRPCGDEPGCVGPLSVRLVRRRQAAGAILIRPPRRVSAGGHELRLHGARPRRLPELAAANIVPERRSDVLVVSR